MFLHLGGDVSVLQKDIIGIFDIYSSHKSTITKEFLEIAKGEKSIIKVSPNEKNKSFIIVGDKLYLSPISSVTLQKRTSILKDEVTKEEKENKSEI